jgi:hypothetical protein
MIVALQGTIHCSFTRITGRSAPTGWHAIILGSIACRTFVRMLADEIIS